MGARSHYKLKQTIQKKQGAAGITTAAPYIAGQWGRVTGCQKNAQLPKLVPAEEIFF
jgi:hypothetical protein